MTVERRTARRYPVDAAITVNDDAARLMNLSIDGVFFETARAFEPGDRVALVFPLAHATPGASATCSAQVVRVEPRGGRYAVAARYEPVSFTLRA